MKITIFIMLLSSFQMSVSADLEYEKLVSMLSVKEFLSENQSKFFDNKDEVLKFYSEYLKVTMLVSDFFEKGVLDGSSERLKAKVLEDLCKIRVNNQIIMSQKQSMDDDLGKGFMYSFLNNDNVIILGILKSENFECSNSPSPQSQKGSTLRDRIDKIRMQSQLKGSRRI